MSLLKRIGLYLLGLSVGAVVVAVFFKKKKSEFCYFPNCRVLKNIRNKQLFINDSLYENTADSLHLSKVIDTILHIGNVDFSESKTSESPKIYVVYTSELKMTITSKDSTAYINNVEIIRDNNDL